MSEILFRAKLKDNSDWIYWNVFGEICKLNGKRTKVSIAKTAGESHYYHIHQIKQFIVPETIGQYIGVKDYVGHKVFSGDIVEYRYQLSKGSYKPFRASVEANEKSFGSYHDVYGFCAYLEYGDIENGEVIGNIYDNPEMLKEGSEE